MESCGCHRINRGDVIPIIVALLVLLLTSVAFANGPSIGFDAGCIVPLANNDIQLVREFVTVPIEGGRAHCQYNLKNLTDKQVTISIGFVTSSEWIDIKRNFAAGYNDANIEVRNGQQRIPVHLEKISKDHWASFVRNPPDSLPVWEMIFSPQKEVILHITYNVEPLRGRDGTSCTMIATYHASTASLWAKNIQYASIEFQFGMLTSQLIKCTQETLNCISIESKPENGILTANGVTWKFYDWEADSNFSVKVDWSE